MKALAIIFGFIIVVAMLGNGSGGQSSKPTASYSSTKLTSEEKTWMDNFNARVVTPFIEGTRMKGCNSIRDERDMFVCVSSLSDFADTVDTTVVWLNANSHQAPGCISSEVSALRPILVTLMGSARDAVSAYHQNNMRKMESSTINFTQGTKSFISNTDSMKASLKTC
jgi:hypothetical protein